MHRGWFNTIKITFVATYIALVFGLQVALGVLPNVEVVTLLLFIAAVYFPVGISVLIIESFICLEGLTYGLGEWIFFYFVVWNLLLIIGLLTRLFVKRYWGLAVLIGALFGYLFGTIDALVLGLFYGPAGLIAYWLKGIIFDVIHGTSNFFIFLIAFVPISKVISLYSEKFFSQNILITNWSQKLLPIDWRIWAKIKFTN